MNAFYIELSDFKVPIVLTAIHAGHELRDEVAATIALDEKSRLQEEDPYTDRFTTVAKNRILVHHSRFEVDLNRPREKAVYVSSEDAWGLKVWNEPPPQDLLLRSLASYDSFYSEVKKSLAVLESRNGRFIVFDLHSYNHRRAGPEMPSADPEQNPEVNIGTGTLVRERWDSIIDRFIGDFRNFDFLGRHLDVRENVKFRGGQFSRWINESFPHSGCALAIEFKKFFMDEWTGEPDPVKMEAISAAIQSTFPGVIEELQRSST